MKKLLRAILIALLLIGSGSAIYVTYLRYAAEHVLVRALGSQAQGRPLPGDIALDLKGMQLQLQEPGTFGALLRPKFEVSRAYLWPSVLERGVVFDVQVGGRHRAHVWRCVERILGNILLKSAMHSEAVYVH